MNMSLQTAEFLQNLNSAVVRPLKTINMKIIFQELLAVIKLIIDILTRRQRADEQRTGKAIEIGCTEPLE